MSPFPELRKAKQATVWAEPNAALAKINFQDNGIGIAAEDKQRLATEHSKQPLETAPGSRRLGLEEGLTGRSQIQLEQ